MCRQRWSIAARPTAASSCAPSIGSSRPSPMPLSNWQITAAQSGPQSSSERSCACPSRVTQNAATPTLSRRSAATLGGHYPPISRSPGTVKEPQRQAAPCRACRWSAARLPCAFSRVTSARRSLNFQSAGYPRTDCISVSRHRLKEHPLKHSVGTLRIILPRACSFVYRPPPFG